MNWDYISGFIQGEGNIAIRLQKSPFTKYGYELSPYIGFSNTDKSVMEEIGSFLVSQGIKYHKLSADKRLGRKVCYNIWISDMDELRKIISNITLYGEKKEELSILIAFMNLKKAYCRWDKDTLSKGLDLYEQIRTYHSKGVHLIKHSKESILEEIKDIS